MAEAGVTRRALLLGAGGVAVAAGGVVTGRQTAAPAEGAETPGEQLMTEHGLLKRVLLVYRRVADDVSIGLSGGLDPLVACAGVIHDYIEGFHEGVEEAYVFPVLRDGPLGPTVTTLLQQHGRGRLITARLLALPSRPLQSHPLAALLERFVQMYEPHEAREDTVIFPAFRTAVGDAALGELAGKVARSHQKTFGVDGFHEQLAVVEAAERELGIAALQDFTPAITDIPS